MSTITNHDCDRCGTRDISSRITVSLPTDNETYAARELCPECVYLMLSKFVRPVAPFLGREMLAWIDGEKTS